MWALMWADLTGCPGSQPKGEGARDLAPARRVDSFSLPFLLWPLLCPLPIQYLSLLYVKMFLFLNSSRSKHAALVQNGPYSASLLGAWVAFEAV